MGVDTRYLAAIAISVVLLLGISIFAISLWSYDYTEAEANIEVTSSQEATVTVNSMGDAEEVIVRSGIEEKTVTEPGEVTISIANSDSVLVQTKEGNVINEVEISGDPGGNTNNDPNNQNGDTVEITEDKLQETHDGLVGEGTESDPYLITTVMELQSIQIEPDAYYAIGQGIDASETEDWDNSRGFDPIDSFTGTLVGQDNTISDLYIDRPTTNDVGLFATAEEATIENVEFENATVNGKNFVGIIAGQSLDSSMSNVSVSGEVSGDNNVGAVAGLTNPTELTDITVTESSIDGGGNNVGSIAGIHEGSIIDSSISDTTVRGSDVIGGVAGKTRAGAVISDMDVPESVNVVGSDDIGGVTGQLLGEARILRVSSQAQVSGMDSVGGVVGNMDSSDAQILATQFRGVAEGDEHVGGVVGYFQAGAVNNSVSSGTVRGSIMVGGLIGRQSNDTVVVQSYSRASVSGDNRVGGLAGTVESAEISDVYWVNTPNNPDNLVGFGESYGVELSTSDVTGSSASESFEQFDFESIWTESVDGPTLQSDLTEESLPDSQEVIGGSNEDGTGENVTVDLTISVVNQFGDDVVSEVSVGEETYALVGTRTLEVDGNQEYTISTRTNGYIDKSKTVQVDSVSKEVNFELIEEGVGSTLEIVIQDGQGNKINGTVSFANEDGSYIVEKDREFTRDTGEYTITAQADGYSSVERTIELDGTDREVVTFQLSDSDSETTQLAITFVNSNQERVPTVVRVNGVEQTVEEGRGVFNVPKNQIITVHPHEGDYIKQPQDVPIQDSPKSLTMELEEATVPLTIDIQAPDGTDISGEVIIGGETHSIDAGGEAIDVRKYTEHSLTISADFRETIEDVVTIEDEARTKTYQLEIGQSSVTLLLQDEEGNPLSGSITIGNDEFSVNGELNRTLTMATEYSVTANAQGYVAKSTIIQPREPEEEHAIQLGVETEDLIIELKDNSSDDPITGEATVGDKTYTVSGSTTVQVQTNAEHTVTADANGYQLKEKTIAMGDDPRKLLFSLEPEEVTLTVTLEDQTTGDPLSGQVTIDDTVYSVNETRDISVKKFNTYDVSASKTDYQPETETIDIEDSNKSLILSLEPEVVDLHVWLEDDTNGDSLSGTVTIDGEQYGVTGDRSIEVYVNKSYTVTANAEGYDPVTKTIDMGTDSTSEVFQLDPE